MDGLAFTKYFVALIELNRQTTVVDHGTEWRVAVSGVETRTRGAE
jgi:hypothetical protein